MGLLTSRHCGQPEPHPKHQGRFVYPQCGPGPHVVCDGDPAHLARQLEREANPPPGPPSPPRSFEWWPPAGQESPNADH